MSLLVTDPELIETAAQDLAGIRTTLGEATASASIPTTGVAAAAADEVSTAIATVFGKYGQEFQALSAQASTFHDEFVNLLNASAGAYISTEVANAEQNLVNAVNAPAQGLLGQAGGAGGLSGLAITNELQTVSGLTGLTGLAGPGSTTGGLGLLGTSGLPGLLGTSGLPGLLGTSGLLGTPGLPGTTGLLGALLADGPVTATYQQLIENTINNLQQIATTWFHDPAPFLSQVIANQISYATITANAFGSAARLFVDALGQLPTNLAMALQALFAGDLSGALAPLVLSLGQLFVVPPLQLLPILQIPGLILQNTTNLYTTITAFTINVSTEPIMLTFGLPVALLFDGVGSLITTGQAARLGLSTGFNFFDTVPTVLNGFVNGEGPLSITPEIPIPGFSSVTANIPAFGILNPESDFISVTAQPVNIGPIRPPAITITIPGTPITGLVPALVNLAPQELADAITPV